VPIEAAAVQGAAADQRPMLGHRRAQRKIQIGALVGLVGEIAGSAFIAGQAGARLRELELVAQRPEVRAHHAAAVEAVLEARKDPQVALAGRRRGEEIGFGHGKPPRSAIVEGHAACDNRRAQGILQERLGRRVADPVFGRGETCAQLRRRGGAEMQRQLRVVLRPRPRPLQSDPVGGRAVRRCRRARAAHRNSGDTGGRPLDHVIAVRVAIALVIRRRPGDAQPAFVAPAVHELRAALAEAARAEAQFGGRSVGPRGDEIDDSAHGVAAVERGIGTAHDLYARHRIERDPGDVDAARERIVERLAVDHHQRARRARDTAQREYRGAGSRETGAHCRAAHV